MQGHCHLLAIYFAAFVYIIFSVLKQRNPRYIQAIYIEMYKFVFFAVFSYTWRPLCHLFPSNACVHPSSQCPRKNSIPYRPPALLDLLFFFSSKSFYLLFYSLIWKQPLRGHLARHPCEHKGLCCGYCPTDGSRLMVDLSAFFSPSPISMQRNTKKKVTKNRGM